MRNNRGEIVWRRNKSARLPRPGPLDARVSGAYGNYGDYGNSSGYGNYGICGICGKYGNYGFCGNY